MNSGLIGKIDKAKKYAEERHRMHVSALNVLFDGENDTHSVNLNGDAWKCTCDFFHGWGACAHTMALERVFQGMVPQSSLAAV